MGKGRRRKKKWIAGAVKKPGAYTRSVRRRHGKAGFTKRGTIKVKVMRADAKKKGVTGKRARLALTLREQRK